MRLSSAVSAPLAVQVGLFAASLSGVFSPAALAAEGFRVGGTVGSLAAQGDLAPVSIRASSPPIGPVASSATRLSLARQSPPLRDRPVTYRNADLFALSKSAVPLLVADLEPRPAAVARPMSGPSVGALPSALWTRSVPASMAPLSESASASSALRW